MLARVLERDRRLGRAARRLADKQRPGLGCGLDARGGVHEITRDHAFARRAERDRRLAREHARTGAKVRRADLVAE